MGPRAWRRGFTLVELLAVVAMVGILAALAIVGFRKYLGSARSGEAAAVIQGIRAGQENARAETLVYLNCSGSLTEDLHRYPQGALPNKQKWSFVRDTHGDFLCWQQLGVATDGPVRFAYSVVAGAPGAGRPDMPTQMTAPPPTWPTTVEPWYVVVALGDSDGDATSYALFLATSFSGEVYSERDSE